MVINTKENKVQKEDSKCLGGDCSFKHCKGRLH